ncbi:PREDICTED: cyclin-D5-1-like [Ipomoea nil]|uniref:cyclin-D5-1-like n=1 Tax=Ipomoea nil TaxID=35883 RepID=UPI000901D1AD|nr:PREDICTED: cyclin-D5-1-like [Ipomoea nil]
MQDSASAFSPSSLLCDEDDSRLRDGVDRGLDFDPCPPSSESDNEYVETLIERDASSQSNNYGVSCDDAWLKCARLEAVNWILNNRAVFGFQLRTAYLSMMYFDQFIARTSIATGKIWAIRLLSIACLSLAAKVEECKVPALSQYHVDDYYFAGNIIQKMELLVLNTLEWKMNLITPFAFVHYFVTKFCGEPRSKELVPKAIELIVDVMKEISLVEHQPSFIAAASVLAVYDCNLTRKTVEIKTSVIPSWGFLEKEHVFSCYSLLQVMDTVKSKTPKSSVLPNSLLPCPCSIVHDKSPTSMAVGSKRRLTYSDNDQLDSSR